ncbi:MAG: host attachment protein [Holophagae bacterium]|jgi:peptide subunit release factor 1 (eRF1)
MLGRGVLSRLHTLTQQETFTLTLYLDIDQNKQANRKRGFVVQAEALLKDLRATHGPDRRLADAGRRALDLVTKLRPKGRSALVVVNTTLKLAELHELNLPLASSAHWRRGAFLRPIVEAMDEHERYGVVLTSTTRARLFTVHMGEITEHDDLISDTSSRSRALGTDQWRSQKRRERRHDEEVANHVKRVIDALHDLALRRPFDRLIIAGTSKATAQLERLLPRRLQGKLVRTVPMAMKASKKEVLEGILKLQERMEREQETSLIEGLEAELHDGGKAVAGFAPVLDAINQGRVWTLLYGKGVTVRGGECSECGAYSPHAKGPCVYCGGDVRPLPQCLDRLSQSVMDMAGRVEVVDGPAAKRLEKHGSIAALLRY